MKKILTVVGARPQFIKAAAISREIRANPGVDEILVHTGQHYDEKMSGVFFDELGIGAPKHQLSVGSGSHGAQTGRMLEAIEKVLFEEKPDWVLVYGDTNSTLAGALAAAKLHIPVAHVEAGLRSNNRRMPEEVNRVLTDHLSSLLFAPTQAAVENAKHEGIDPAKVHLVGDVMYDVTVFTADRAERESRILEELKLDPGKYALATSHRAENTDVPARIEAIVDGLALLSARMPVVLPLHPRTRKILGSKLDSLPKTLRIVEPMGYLDMVRMERNAAVIATDSGGVQKEAFFFKVPCVTFRDETEWTELVDSGWNRLVKPVSAQAVLEGVSAAIGTKGKDVEPYGKKDASRKIIQAILKA